MTISERPSAQRFRFTSAVYEAGVVELGYAFDEGPELVERISFPGAPETVPAGREAAFARALRLLHGIAGVSYYKALLPPEIVVDGEPFDAALAALLEQVYLHGLGEFAHENRLDLRGRIRFPTGPAAPAATELGLPRRALVPIGGGKDSLVSVELLRQAGEPFAVTWVGRSELIRACALATGQPMLAIGRELAPELFELNRRGAWNGHIPVTAINSAILVCAALLYGYDAVVFSNESSASVGNLEHGGIEVNHQWSKGLVFENALAEYLDAHVAADLRYYSLLRPLSELAVAQRFAGLTRYHALFSSCNRNFRLLGERPSARWCGHCPKCRFVFLALAPFLAKPALLAIFGRNLLDEPEQVDGFAALAEFGAAKPFECVGEGRESRAALARLAERADWREDSVVRHYAEHIAPAIAAPPRLEELLAPKGAHRIPERIWKVLEG